MRRLERLKTDEYAYSTVCENAKEKAELTTQSLAAHARRTKKDMLKTMDVPELGKPVSQYSNSSTEKGTNKKHFFKPKGFISSKFFVKIDTELLINYSPDSSPLRNYIFKRIFDRISLIMYY